ncbi:hypothetical protein [Metabacillus sp. 22489]|uniref:hypothetical protein n=1 Tax=Metabacillus sp. 22489 TaxID=3453928 RepID=UPI003F85B5C1
MSTNTNLHSVSELNETVWKDSKEVFDILNGWFEGEKRTESESNIVDNYIERYYDSGYTEIEGSESYLVTAIYNLYINEFMKNIGEEADQEERINNYKKLYMEVEQKFVEKNID